MEVAPYQRVDLREFGLSTEQLETQAFWVGEGAPVGGAAAIGRALRAAGGGRAVLGWAVSVWPISALARVVYRIVARNRHRLSRSGSCALPRTAVGHASRE